jgi:ABC-type transport system involved in multi-copper enzyme maturation permease subunit
LLSSFWAITKNSFIEIIRQPVYGILLLAGLVLIGLSAPITMFSMASDESLMVDMGLATISLLGLVVAVLSATQVVSREIESQTVGAIISKPVGRFSFLLGKFASVSLAMTVCCYLLTAMLLIMLRIGVPSTASWAVDGPAFAAAIAPLLLAVAFGIYSNYFYRWNFTSTAILLALPLYTVAFAALLVVNGGLQFEFIPKVFAERHAWQVARAALLVFLGVWVLSSVAVVVSTRLNVVMNVIICLTIFFVGTTSQYLFGRFADSFFPAWLALRAIPSFYVFWVGDQLMAEVPYIPMPYIATAAAYALGFSAAMVLLAAFLFERREVT